MKKLFIKLENPHNKPCTLKKRCIRLCIFLLCLFALTYIFVPYKYTGKSTSGTKVALEYKGDFGLMSLETTMPKDINVSYYVRGKKVEHELDIINNPSSYDRVKNLNTITEKEDFYAIIETNPNEKVYLKKHKDISYLYKKIKGFFDTIHDANLT